MGNHVLNFEELSTLFCQIEMVMNSRPIGVLSEDPKDPGHLTTAHLCCGDKLESLPDTAVESIADLSACKPIKRWAFVRNLVGSF